MSVKSPVPMINNTIGGDKRISPEDISLNKISILRNIKGITVPKKRLIISPIKNENTESSIKGLDPAMNMLRTSLPSGSVPKRCWDEGSVGWGKTLVSNPTIGSYIFSGQYDPSRNECKKLKEIKKIKNKYPIFPW